MAAPDTPIPAFYTFFALFPALMRLILTTIKWFLKGFSEVQAVLQKLLKENGRFLLRKGILKKEHGRVSYGSHSVFMLWSQGKGDRSAKLNGNAIRELTR
jgi:hypothetical protein